MFCFCISLWGAFLFILPVKLVWSPKHHYRVRNDLSNWISTWEIGFWGIGFPHWGVNDSNTNSKGRASFGISLQTNSQTLDWCYFLQNCRFFHCHFSYCHLHNMDYGLNSKLCWVSEWRLWHSAELHNHVRLSEGLESIFKAEDLQKKTHFRNGTQDIQYKKKRCQIR